MKKLTLILLLVLPALSARAQEGIPLLDKVQGQRVQFHYTYSLSQNGEAFRSITDGNVTVEDNAYMLEGLGLRVLSDGTTRWTLDAEAGEVLVETVVKEDLYTNPALFIASYRDHLSQLKVNEAGAGFLDVTLTLDEQNQARFVLKDITYSPQQGKSDFSLDEKSLPDTYVITDLR